MIRFTRRTRFSFVAIISVLALAVGILGFAKAARSETTYDVLHAFRNIAGLNPVIRTTNGYFYGTTQRGGQYDGGTVFKLAPDGSSFSLLHSFNYSDGYYPNASLIQGSDGTLYGTTPQGGQYGAGTVFKLASDCFSRLYSFNSSDGAYPQASLTQGDDDNLYGTASRGGPEWGGVVFRLLLDNQSPNIMITSPVDHAEFHLNEVVKAKYLDKSSATIYAA